MHGHEKQTLISRWEQQRAQGALADFDLSPIPPSPHTSFVLTPPFLTQIRAMDKATLTQDTLLALFDGVEPRF